MELFDKMCIIMWLYVYCSLKAFSFFQIMITHILYLLQRFIRVLFYRWKNSALHDHSKNLTRISFAMSERFSAVPTRGVENRV